MKDNNRRNHLVMLMKLNIFNCCVFEYIEKYKKIQCNNFYIGGALLECNFLFLSAHYYHIFKLTDSNKKYIYYFYKASTKRGKYLNGPKYVEILLKIF